MRRILYNEDYFEQIDSPEKAYYLGFIFADGSIRSTKRKQLTIKIHPKDIDFLENFKGSINYQGDIYFDKKRNICQISISGKKIISDLINKGVVENKTSTLKYPDIDESFELDFIRGFFDGDGCIRIKFDKRTGQSNGHLVIVCGSNSFLSKLNERMSILFDIKLNKVHGPKNKEYQFIGWTGLSDIENIYERFYLKSSIYLKRKKLIFDEVYKIHKSKIKYRKK